MKTLNRAVGISLLTMLASCAANKQTVSASPYLSSVVTSALKDVELTYTQKRTPVTFVSGDVADSCQRYFALMENSQVKEGVNNLKAAQNYVICDTVKVVSQAIDSEFVASGVTKPGAMLAEHVALDSFPSSVYQRTDEKNNSLSVMFKDALALTQYSVLANAKDWHYALTLHAILDVNGDGAEDWVIWLTDKAKSGNYSIMAGFYASNVRENTAIKLLPLRDAM